MSDEIKKEYDKLDQKYKESIVKKPPKSSKIFYNTSFFIEMLVGLAVGFSLGYYVDFKINTKPLFIFLFSIFGIAGGIYNGLKNMK